MAYQEIDKLEKSKIEVREVSRKSEEFFLWALIAMVLLGFEIIFRLTILKTNP